MIVEKQMLAKDLESLRTQLKGMLLVPGDEQYDQFAQPWNLDARQHPSLVVVPSTVEDIQAAVCFAGEQNLGIGVMATGHGVGRPCNSGLLINTSAMRGVTIDPFSLTATVEAGAQWKDVVEPASRYGLATLAGSAPHVGVVGYTMGGGFGYLGRKWGLNSDAVVSATVVTADGELLTVSADQHEDLFWGLKGGGGNFGIVASLRFRLFPISTVYGGAVFYPIECAREALAQYTQWAGQVPDEVSTAFAFMNIPALPAVPEPLRGRSVVVIKGCYCGALPEAGEEIFAPIRRIAKPVADTFNLMPVTAMDAISKDPVDPMGVLQYSGMISRLSPEAIDTIVAVAGKDAGSPLLMVELRRLGGALQHQGNGINLMGDQNAQFSLNALGATFNPLLVEKVQSHLALLAEATKPYQTGEVFINFMETDPAADRVRAAYTPKHWQRLTALKRKYDPKNVFRFNRNISPKQASTYEPELIA